MIQDNTFLYIDKKDYSKGKTYKSFLFFFPKLIANMLVILQLLKLHY